MINDRACQAALRELDLTYRVTNPAWLRWTPLGPTPPNPLNPRGDADGDGFLNHQEWDYLRLYGNNPETLTDVYAVWVLDPELYPPVPVDCIPKTTVRIDVTGQGWVYPGVGDHQFATYAQTCALSCPVTTPPECEYNTVTLLAEPAAGWAFRRWWGVDEDVAREPALAVTCDAPQFISAEFVARPGLDTLDLVADLGAFLVAIEVNEDVEDVYNLDYDRGDFEFDEYGARIFTGNGIPDAAEFALLDAVIHSVTLDLSARGGIASDFTWADYAANAAQAAADLPEQDAAVQRAVAAYMTLGDYGYRVMVRNVVRAHFTANGLPVEIDASDYKNITARYFAPEKDADNDGAMNLTEWSNTLANVSGTGEEQVRAFAQSALDPDTDGAPEPTEGEPEGQTEGQAEGQAEGQGEGQTEGQEEGQTEGQSEGQADCDCGNDVCASAASLTIQTSTGLDVEACVLDPPPCGPSELPIGSPPSNIQRGRLIYVEASPESLFDYWHAEDTLIDGSIEEVERFTHSNGGQLVQAMATNSYITVRGVDRSDRNTKITATAMGKGSEAVTAGWNQSHTSYDVLGPSGTLVTIEYEVTNKAPHNPPWPDEIETGWIVRTGELNTRQTRLTSVTVELGVALELEATLGAECVPSTRWSNSGTATGGGRVFVNNVLGSFVICARQPGHPMDMKFEAIPFAPFAFHKWDNCEGLAAFFPILGLDCTVLTGPRSASAIFVPRPVLELPVKTMGGAGSPRCAGYCTADPATKYYNPPTAAVPEFPPYPAVPSVAQVVKLDAHPRAGYHFDHWEGDGVCWLSASGSSEHWTVTGDPHPLDDDNAPITAGTIYIKMAEKDDESEPANRTVTSVFQKSFCEIECNNECYEPYAAGPWVRIWGSGIPHCPPRSGEGSYPTLSDNCGNVIALSCNGLYYTVTYNGKPIAKCVFNPAENQTFVRYVSGSQRFHSITHITGESTNPPEGQDFEPDYYNWVEYAYDCICDSWIEGYPECWQIPLEYPHLPGPTGELFDYERTRSAGPCIYQWW
jgi:hypothetical protein